MQITRSEQSLGRFYGAYVALTGWFIALCLNVEAVEPYRVLWSLLDTILIAYLCLLNPWFRNKLVGWVIALSTLERR